MEGVGTRRNRKRPAPPSPSPGAPSSPPPSPSAGSRALQIEVVMAKIAGKLSSNTLQTLRAACSIWNRGFVAELRRRRHGSVELKNGRGSASCSMAEFTNLHRSTQASSDNTFTDYSLIGIGANPKGALDFFNVCGSSVRILTLEPAPEGNYLVSEGGILYETLRAELWDMVPELEELEIHARALEKPIWSSRHKFRISRLLPKLKKLTMSGFDAESAHPSHQALLNELIRAAVGLEALVIKNLGSFSVGVALRDCSTNLGKLRDLELNHLNVDAVDMGILIELSRRPQNALRLAEFRCTAAFVNINAELGPLLHEFFEAQAPTLRELEVLVIGLKRAEMLPVRIPPMPILKTLRIAKAGETHGPVRCDRGSLASNFPQLRRLQLLDIAPPKAEPEAYRAWMDLLRVSAHGGVTELNLGGVNMGRLRVLDRHRLEFPALTRLDLEVTSTWTAGEVSSLWTTWPALEALSITFRRGEERFVQAEGTLYRKAPEWDLNEFLTGVPLSSFPEVKRQLGARPASAPRMTLEKLRRLLGKYKTRPGISDLRRLQGFGLTIYCADATLSEVGGYLGLAVASPTLRHVVVTRGDAASEESAEGGVVVEAPPACQMQPRCLALIVEALGPLTVLDLDV